MFRYSCLQRFIGGGGSGGVTIGGTRICLARQPSLAAERTSSKAILPPYSSSATVSGKVTITQRNKSSLKQHSKKAGAGPKSSDTTSANEIPTSLKKKAAQTISSVGVGNTSGIEFVPVGRVPSLEDLEPVVASLNEIRAWMHSTLPKKQFVYTLPVDSIPSLSSTTTTSKRTTTKGKLSEKVIEEAGNIVEKRVLKHTKVLPDHFFIDSVTFGEESTKKVQEGRGAELEVVFSIIEPSKKVIKLLDAMKA